ncbi:OmpA family protein [Pseudozobellia sp. WGM2]|uniref:OmpA family protein n=1 Tax=Pseudozobellia sp. WGM2 TaxID=2787625 RepID=UPI001AE08C32|nr:OmpA family protein [Pseudozobellia sp. WGM2]
MKFNLSFFKSALTLAAIFLLASNANAQFLKKLGKAAERAAERTVERRVEQETAEKTDQALDSIFEPGAKGSNKRQNPVPNTSPSPDSQDHQTDQDSKSKQTNGSPPSSSNDPESLSVYSKFDFVPGDAPLFVDDFSHEFVGDFPSRWNTNAGGDLVNIEGHENKWLKLLPGSRSFYIPDITNLPDEFTLEFDVVGSGIDKKTSSHSYLGITVVDNNTFEKGQNWGKVEYSFCQFIERGFVIENNISGKRGFYNETQADVRSTVKQKHRVSIAVNGQRFRLWLNESKYVDVPRLLPQGIKMQGIKFMLRGIDTDKESIYISNIKIAKGGVDLRRKLLADGKISTNGILFDSGSANIQPQSMGIIRQIYQVLQQDDSINLKIVGHTDGDGDDGANMALSEKRAEAVKDALVNIYNVSSKKLSVAGKGESEPVGDNNTPDGKALNRRVEFIKQ